jgi:SAM-dependent methyltransferase
MHAEEAEYDASSGPTSALESPDWADEMGRRWLGCLDLFEGTLAPIGAALIEHARFSRRERVVDVGCGAGPSTLVISRRVSPGGLALGLDVSPVLIDAAMQRASRPGAVLKDADVRFCVGDAAAVELEEAPFDVIFSRFGLLFFDDPYAAFEHMRGWLKPTKGRIVFSCWAPVEENPWIYEPHAIIRRHINTPELQPNAPGPFGLADVARLNDILVTAGFVDIRVQAWRGELPIAGAGANSMMATDLALNGMHASEQLAQAPDDVKAKVRRDIEALYKARHGVGGVMMPASAWLVTAKDGGGWR